MLLRLSPPPLPHTNALIFIHTLHIFYLPSLWSQTHDPAYFRILINSLSISIVEKLMVTH